MKVRFKEDPREWRKFTLSFGGAPLVLGGLLWWRGVIGANGWLTILATVALFELILLPSPRWCRAFYRGGLSVGARVGNVMGQVLLTGIFFLVLTPVGWLLRLGGKDLLHLKRRANVESHWHPPRKNGGMERMF
ncbi:MAG: hypothetical protein H7A45_05585 [Verrucomicrobiales bacterium]|nr:hypothetical protein [Verrucomicrobiales bacterium]